MFNKYYYIGVRFSHLFKKLSKRALKIVEREYKEELKNSNDHVSMADDFWHKNPSMIICTQRKDRVSNIMVEFREKLAEEQLQQFIKGLSI